MGGSHAISMRRAIRLLRRALPAIVNGDVGAIGLFTDDVIGESPNLRVRSRAELECHLTDRAGALSDIEFAIDRIERSAGGLTVTWHLSGFHTGVVLFNEDELFDPSGRRVDLSARTEVQFRARRICAFETSYDGQDLIDQIRPGPAPAGTEAWGSGNDEA